jgi:hypothetical protein
LPSLCGFRFDLFSDTYVLFFVDISQASKFLFFSIVTANSSASPSLKWSGSATSDWKILKPQPTELNRSQPLHSIHQTRHPLKPARST